MTILRHWLPLVVLAFGIAAVPAQAQDRPSSFPLPETLTHTVVEAIWPDVQSFYREREGAPLWFDENGAMTDRARRAIAHLGNAEQEGLDPAHYDAARLAQAIDGNAPADPDLDLSITGQLLHFLYEVRQGRLRDSENAVAATFDVSQALDLLANAPDIAAALRNAVPGNAPYRALRRALSTYQAIANSGHDAPIPDGPAIKPGTTDPRLPHIRDRLARLGDLVAKPAGVDETIYGPVLEQSVTLFQKRHGLEPDGVIGKKTLAELNFSIEARINQIAVNMERWRWLPGDLGDNYILVNIAGFRLEVFELGVPALEMAVVVGRPFRRTPVFSAEISYLEFSPTWTVPPTILKEDIIPGMRKDPELLSKKGITIFDGWNRDAAIVDPTSVDWNAPASRLMGYRYVQPPGEQNALGRVKFMFPNQYSVYLHDTPDKTLFGRASRAFSSGCIRVQQPAVLAELLLRDQSKWDGQAIAKAMALDAPMRVNLSTPMPIYITYATVWAGEGGTIEFRPDIYERDAGLQEQLLSSPY